MPGPLSTIQITMSEQTRALLLEQGERYASTARQVGLSEYHLRKWARRFCVQGVAGLRERPRSGRPPVFAPQVALYVVKLAWQPLTYA